MANKKRLDKLIVVDIEATCWERSPDPPIYPHEIIEIGVCEILNTPIPTIGRRKQYYVKPEIGTISQFCVDLTGISSETVVNSPFLKQAIEEFKSDFLTDRFIWVSWGDYDRDQFRRECQLKNIDYPFGSRHINLKSLFSSLHGVQDEFSVKKAMAFSGMEFDGRLHSGVDDAFNIGRLLVNTYSLFRRGL
jgi:inhibitor of KinA sporulation pathway (predicted exonuclease)